jgi:hypothetical protein
VRSCWVKILDSGVQEKRKTDLCQPPSDSTSLLGAKVEREVLLVLVELSEVLTLLLICNS